MINCRYLDEMIDRFERVGFGYYVNFDEMDDKFGK